MANPAPAARAQPSSGNGPASGGTTAAVGSPPRAAVGNRSWEGKTRSLLALALALHTHTGLPSPPLPSVPSLASGSFRSPTSWAPGSSGRLGTLSTPSSLCIQKPVLNPPPLTTSKPHAGDSRPRTCVLRVTQVRLAEAAFLPECPLPSASCASLGPQGHAPSPPAPRPPCTSRSRCQGIFASVLEIAHPSPPSRKHTARPRGQARLC